ncbi:MAG: UDP-N-acetylmuramate dehydrogenase [Bacillota bacterium]
MADFQRLYEALRDCAIERDVPMRRYTTFRAGGNAKLMLFPNDPKQIALALFACEDCGVPWYIVGNGSNLLVRDGGIDALVIRFDERMGGIARQGDVFRAGAGQSLSALANFALKSGYMGLEWAAGIPGTVGGAVAMNAGAYGGQLSDVIKSVRVIQNGREETLEVKAGDMGYRTSAYAAPSCIVLEAAFRLSPDDGDAVGRQADYMRRRREKQPLTFASAGSTFKRPEGYFAGVLIEQAGLKGESVGDAQVSTLHAGFIINRGNATASDILELIRRVQKHVFENSGVFLEPEIKIIGKE